MKTLFITLSLFLSFNSFALEKNSLSISISRNKILNVEFVSKQICAPALFETKFAEPVPAGQLASQKYFGAVTWSKYLEVTLTNGKKLTYLMDTYGGGPGDTYEESMTSSHGDLSKIAASLQTWTYRNCTDSTARAKALQMETQLLVEKLQRSSAQTLQINEYKSPAIINSAISILDPSLDFFNNKARTATVKFKHI